MTREQLVAQYRKEHRNDLPVMMMFLLGACVFLYSQMDGVISTTSKIGLFALAGSGVLNGIVWAVRGQKAEDAWVDEQMAKVAEAPAQQVPLA